MSHPGALTEGRAIRPPLIVTSALAIMSKTIPRRDFVAACHILKPGMAAEPLELLRRWQSMGYETEDACRGARTDEQTGWHY